MAFRSRSTRASLSPSSVQADSGRQSVAGYAGLRDTMLEYFNRVWRLGRDLAKT